MAATECHERSHTTAESGSSGAGQTGPFTGEYKQRIPAAADAAKRAGEIGASCGGKASTAGDVQERSAMRQHTRVCRNSGGVRSNQAGQLGFEENALAQTAVSSRWTVTF